MQHEQSIGELHTHDSIPHYDDLPKTLEFYGARIGRDLGVLHELTEGKIALGVIVEIASLYEHLLKDPEADPKGTPAEIFERDIIPILETELVVTEEGVADETLSK
jgi:hypothetical protein